jgi:hypothetical protein
MSIVVISQFDLKDFFFFGLGVEIAISKLKTNKLPGTDQIPAELMKAGGETLCSEIHRLICSILNKEELSQQCKESIIIEATPYPNTCFRGYAWPHFGCIFISQYIIR